MMASKKFKFFEKHPELYEVGFSYRKIDQQVAFLDKLFKKYKSKKILDVACGPSPQGRKLAKKGYNVSGIDISYSLLKFGKLKAKQENVKINFYKRDMRRINIGKFDAAYIMFSSILHLHNSEDFLSHFRSINKSLKKNGRYIIDLSSLPFYSPFKSATFINKKGKVKTIIHYEPLDVSNLTAKFTCISFFNNKKYNEDTFIILMFMPLIFLSSYAQMAGFEIQDIYSDFKFNKKLKKKKPEYIAILKKVREIK